MRSANSEPEKPAHLQVLSVSSLSAGISYGLDLFEMHHLEGLPHAYSEGFGEIVNS